MERIEEHRPHWWRRAFVLALVFGLIGWIVAYATFVVLLQALVAMETSPAHAAAGRISPGLEADLMLGALAYGVPCGTALGLIICAMWFLVRLRAMARKSDSSARAAR
jgi:hypothetical protein